MVDLEKVCMVYRSGLEQEEGLGVRGGSVVRVGVRVLAGWQLEVLVDLGHLIGLEPLIAI